jgi:hypothetical protein
MDEGRLGEQFQQNRTHLRAVAHRMLGSFPFGSNHVVVAPRGRLFVVLNVTVARGRIVGIDVVTDPARLRRLSIAVL